MSKNLEHKPKIWLKKGSPNDPVTKMIRDRMGECLSDFMAVVTGSKPDLEGNVWPKHTIQELSDPTHMAYCHDYSKMSWPIRYKALGSYGLQTPTRLPSGDKGVKQLSDSHASGRKVNDIITLAQQKELIKTLQLSDSDDDSDHKNSDSQMTEMVAKSPIAEPNIQHRKRLYDNTGNRSCLLSRVSPHPSQPMTTKEKPLNSPLENVQHLQNQGDLSIKNSKTHTSSCKSEIRLEKLHERKISSPPAGRVSNGNLFSVNNPNSDSAVSLPPICMSNRENVPSTSMNIKSQYVPKFVRRVLADAENFCKPFQDVSDNFLDDIDKNTFESVHEEGITKTGTSPCFILKKVSPLPKNCSEKSHSTFPDGTHSPVPKKNRKMSSSKASVSGKRKASQIIKAETPIHICSQSSLYIVDSLNLTDVRSHIAMVFPRSTETLGSTTDKLAKIHKILGELKVPIQSFDDSMSRPLSGILIVPRSDEPTLERTDRGTLTTPKNTLECGTHSDVWLTADSATQMSPCIQVVAVTNTSPSCLKVECASVGVNTSPISPHALERDLHADEFSISYCLDQVIGHNKRLIEHSVRSYEKSTEEQQLISANQIDIEAAQCWSRLVKYVAATSSSSIASSTPIQPVCSCTSDNKRLLHFLFSQADFTSYPARVLASTRRLIIAALMSTSVEDAKRRYDQVLESLAKTANRMQRADSKLLRRAWIAVQCDSSDAPVNGIAELGDEAKEWSDLWYSALARVKSVISERFYQLLSEKEQQLRQKIKSDKWLKQLHILDDKGEFLVTASASSNDEHKLPVHFRIHGSSNSSLTERRNVPEDAHLRMSSCNSASNSNAACEASEPEVEMCTVPRSTLEHLLHVFQITELAHDSTQFRCESELVSPTDRLSFWGSDQRWLPVFVASASPSNITALIVYIDKVLQRHEEIVTKLGTCPEAKHKTISTSVPISPVNKPQSIVFPQPADKRPTKRPRLSSPAFEQPPVPLSNRVRKHQTHKQSNRRSYDASNFDVKSTKPTKHQKCTQPVRIDPIVEKTHREAGTRPPKPRSRCPSVATPHFENSHKSDREADNVTRPRCEENPVKDKLAVRSKRPPPAVRVNGVGVESYSPGINVSIGSCSYSPSRPTFSNERQGSNVGGDYQPTYIPSTLPKRSLLHAMPAKPPAFYTKWLNKSSSGRR